MVSTGHDAAEERHDPVETNGVGGGGGSQGHPDREDAGRGLRVETVPDRLQFDNEAGEEPGGGVRDTVLGEGEGGGGFGEPEQEQADDHPAVLAAGGQPEQGSGGPGTAEQTVRSRLPGSESADCAGIGGEQRDQEGVQQAGGATREAPPGL